MKELKSAWEEVEGKYIICSAIIIIHYNYLGI